MEKILMKDKFKALTNDFGKALIKETRDETICQGHKQVDAATDDYYTDIYSKLDSFSPEQRDVVKDIVIDSIDRTLTNFLWAMDQNERFDIIAYEEDRSIFYSLKDVNAGLYDEYYYFVQDFSKFKMIELKEYDGKTIAKQLPDERIMALFDENKPEAAKREFVKIMNKKAEFDVLKDRVPLMPQHIVESLIEMTLSHSSFHKEQCDELRKLII
jgi:hypothetical protein